MEVCMKRIIVIMMAVTLVFSLTACGGRGDNDALPDTISPPAPEPINEAIAAEEEEEEEFEQEGDPESTHHEVEPGIFIDFSPDIFKIGNAPYLLFGTDGNSQISFLHNIGVDFEAIANGKIEAFDIDVDKEVTLGSFTARKLSWEREDFGVVTYNAMYIIEFEEKVGDYEGVVIELWSYEDDLDSPKFMDVLNSYMTA